MVGGAGSGVSRASSGRPRHSTSGTSSQPNSEPSSASRGHRHSVSDTRLDSDEATTSTGRRSAFLEPLPLSRSPSAANSSAVSSPTSPSSTTGLCFIENNLLLDTSNSDNDGHNLYHIDQLAARRILPLLHRLLGLTSKIVCSTCINKKSSSSASLL